MLQLNNIRKKYGTHLILAIPALQLPNGMYWIKGMNGSGKTTFLKMIAGLLSFEGTICVNNISLKKEPLAYRRLISWAEAEPLFPSFMTGKDLIALYCNVRKVSPKEADFFIERFNMTDYISHAIGTYSAGMTKKLSLLLSFLGNPSLIILDEPLITLDLDSVINMCALIKEMRAKNNTSFLLSSHQDIDQQLLSFDETFLVQNKTITAI